jgi:hypothetical protein
MATIAQLNSLRWALSPGAKLGDLCNTFQPTWSLVAFDSLIVARLIGDFVEE